MSVDTIARGMAADAQTAAGNAPRIGAYGTWEVWDSSTDAYVSTGVSVIVNPPIVVSAAADMTDHGHVYIYNGSESGYQAGYWYYWNGSAWTVGGAYQVAATDKTLSVSNAAADAKVTGDSIGELKSQLIPFVGENVVEIMLRIEPPGLGKNLFNKYSLFNLYGGYHDRNNVWVVLNNMMETHYIPVEESENYAFTHSSGGFVLWYKKDLSFLSYSDYASSDAYVTAPLNAAFIKIAFSILNVNGVPRANTMQVEKGTAQTSYEEFIKNNSKYKAELIQAEYGIININNSDLLETDNLFDINADNILNGYYNRTNSFVSSGTLGQSDFIEVFEGYEYSFATTGTFVLWYDGQKNYITYTNISDTAQKVTAPARAKYVRGIFVLTNINSYWVKCEKIKRIKANYPNPFNGLKGVAFGTSLTYRAQTTGGYLQYLPGLTEMTWDNQGLGSATILDNGTQPEMLSVITGYSNWSDKNVCILEGFVNDWYYNGAELGTWKDTGTTTVCGCVRYALNYILTQNANLTVYLVLDHFGKGITATTAVNGAGDTQLEFYEEIEKVALSLGIRVIREYEISEISELTPQFLLDNIHLNDLGAKQSANAIWAGMKKYYPNEAS